MFLLARVVVVVVVVVAETRLARFGDPEDWRCPHSPCLLIFRPERGAVNHAKGGSSPRPHSSHHGRYFLSARLLALVPALCLF